MISILLTILPVFLLIATGYGAMRLKYVPDTLGDALNAYAIKIAVPVLLFRAMANLDFAAAFSPALLASFYGGAFTCFALGIAGARLVFRRTPGEAVAVGFAATFSNSVLLGLAILDQSFGAVTQTPAFGIIAFHAPSIYIVGMVTMELMRRDGRPLGETLKTAGRSILANPLMIGILIGVAVNFSGLGLPGPLDTATSMIAASAIPAALVGIGASMTRYRLGSGLAEAGMVAALSLIVHPAIVIALGLFVFALTSDQLHAAVTLAAMPPGVNVYVFAAMYKRSVETAASAFLLATMLAVLSVTGWIWVLGHLVP